MRDPPPVWGFVPFGDGQIGSSCGAEQWGRVGGGGGMIGKAEQRLQGAPGGHLGGPPPIPTHHHQECRKPGGSPSVMFFSHRICGAQRDAWSRSEPCGTGRGEEGDALGAGLTHGATPPHKTRLSPRTGTSARISGLPRAGGTHRRTAPTCRAGRGGAVTPGRRRGGAGTPRRERRCRRTRPRARLGPVSAASPAAG